MLSAQTPSRILIIDDSSVFRRLLARSVTELEAPTIVETAPLGSIGLKKIPEFRPDMVLLDIEMPEMNGVEVLKEIKRINQSLPVILISGVNSHSADITIEGLNAGAMDFIPKPNGQDLGENIAELKKQIKQAMLMVSTKRFSESTRSQMGQVSVMDFKTPAAPLPHGVTRRVDIVGIGISTGGPSALEFMLPQFPKDFPVPIVIVQHMPPFFTASLARSLNNKSALEVVEAEDHKPIRPGYIYIAPGGMHLLIKKQPSVLGTGLIAKLDDSPPVNSCKPAVDALFKSLALTTGGNTLSVVMTGMGSDGKEGVEWIKNQGGYCLTQDKESSTVYGMPQMVETAGLSDEILPLSEMAERIKELVKRSR